MTNRTLSVDFVNKEADRSLAIELGTWSAMTSFEVVGSDCVGELGVDSLLTLVTFVEFFESLRSLVFPPRLLVFPVFTCSL